MKLEELIEHAYKTSRPFKKRWDYWVTQRKKMPDDFWLLTHLESALGKEFLETAMKAEIARKQLALEAAAETIKLEPISLEDSWQEADHQNTNQSSVSP